MYMYNIHINVHGFIHTHTQKHTISFFSNSPPSFHPPSMCPKNIDFFQSSKKCHRSLQRPPKRTPWDPDPDRSRKVPAAVGQTLSSSHGVWSQPKVGGHCAEGGEASFRDVRGVGHGWVGFGEGNWTPRIFQQKTYIDMYMCRDGVVSDMMFFFCT